MESLHQRAAMTFSPNKKGHYRLEALDSKYGDDKVAGTNQSLLRLHETGSGQSFGCVSIIGDESREAIDSLLSRTSTSKVAVDSKSRNPLKWGSKEPETRYGSVEIVTGNAQRLENNRPSLTSRPAVIVIDIPSLSY